MRADRNHIVEILKLERTENEFGEPIENWVVFKNLYTSYEPIFGNQYFSAEQMRNGTTVKFEGEWVDGITRDMRVRHDNKLYDINSDPINLRGRNTTLILYCKDVIL